MLASDLLCGADVAAFARACGLQPDDWQSRALRSHHPRQVYNTSRQSGKSTVAALKSLHRAIYHPGSLVLLVSPSLRQSTELFRKVLAFSARTLESAPLEAETQLRLEMANGSRIISLPGSQQTTRGYSAVDLLVIDEASRVPDELYLSLRPTLAVSQGSVIVLSTPYGTRGFFYDIWHSREDWERFMVTAAECVRIDPVFLEEEKRSMGEWFWRQEYGAEFMSAQTQAFTRELVEALINPEVETWEL